MQILSNGVYKSVLHRSTVDKGKARISWPVFLEPPAEFVVGPLPQLVNEENPPKYKAKNFKDYAYCKLNKLPQ
jgi:flavonol synthase